MPRHIQLLSSPLSIFWLAAVSRGDSGDIATIDSGDDKRTMVSTASLILVVAVAVVGGDGAPWS